MKHWERLKAEGEEGIRWHHQWNGHELGQTLGDGEGQGSWRAAVHGGAKNQTRLGY